MQFLVKAKFTHVSNTPNTIREDITPPINSGGNLHQYFTLNKLRILSYNKNNDFSVLHMNIDLLKYHFDELQTFLSMKMSH